MQFTVHAAKTQLSKLIEAALAGEEVVIAKGAKPVVRLVAIPQTGLQFGGLEELSGTIPAFDEPMPEDEVSLWEGGG